ncbi:MAG: SUMF1/EgtB/PvdO family nonheme iron enzyme [Saprospiraceae bacterium]|nr:SUMF1/EgtB/PvdO family nonheme iron enzyme [Saprospiraceae bacterium]
MSARYLSLLLFLFPLLHQPATTAPPRTGKDLAVFFAVEKYQNGSLTNLQNPVKNAREIAATLQSRFGFETEVLENPTQAQIIAKLNELTRLYATNADGRHPADGQLLLFFSGHGMSEDENGYFLPADADPAQPWAKGIAYEIWRPKIDRINCRHILVAIDACYSVRFDPDWKNRPDGQFKRPGELTDAQKALANYEQYTARVFFTSDNKEDKTPDRSNFARKLLEGLSAPPGPEGYLTSSQLFANHVQGATPTPRAGNFGSDDPRATFLFFGLTETPTAPADPDEATWRSAQRQNTPEAYAYYLEAYPQGRYRAQALDERAWLLAVRQNTPAAYQIYLDTYPNGRHRTEAAAKMPSPAPVEMGPVGEASWGSLRPDEFIRVKGGTFKMGCTSEQQDCDSNEKPVHQVTLSDFYIGKYEVTQKQWRMVMGSDDPRLYNRGCDECPAEGVSWDDVQEFLKKLNQSLLAGQKPYRLPTEAEWEYAAREGGKAILFGNGKNVAYPTKINFDGDWDPKPYSVVGVDRKKTTPVGSFPANALGLYDMSGNVWEWCEDVYHETYEGAPSDGSAWLIPSGNVRVVRGGSYRSAPLYCRAAYRNSNAANNRNEGIGFRLARTL